MSIWKTCRSIWRAFFNWYFFGHKSNLPNGLSCHYFFQYTNSDSLSEAKNGQASELTMATYNFLNLITYFEKNLLDSLHLPMTINEVCNVCSSY